MGRAYPEVTAAQDPENVGGSTYVSEIFFVAEEPASLNGRERTAWTILY